MSRSQSQSLNPNQGLRWFKQSTMPNHCEFTSIGKYFEFFTLKLLELHKNEFYKKNFFTQKLFNYLGTCGWIRGWNWQERHCNKGQKIAKWKKSKFLSSQKPCNFFVFEGTRTIQTFLKSSDKTVINVGSNLGYCHRERLWSAI